MSGKSRLPFCFFAPLSLFCALSCVPPRRPIRESAGVDVVAAVSAFQRPYATVKPSGAPSWFEFGLSGPVPVSGPLDSSLSPFEPWPLARRGVGIVAAENSATIVANRDGFISLVSRPDGDIAVYRVADETRFAPYSVTAAFLHGGAPAAVVHRDRFFIDPVGPPPEPRAFILQKGLTELSPADLPLLSAYPAGQGWDIESLAAAPDGRIVLRAVRDDAVAYAAAAVWDAEKTDISAAEFRSASSPISRRRAPMPLRCVFDAAAAELPTGEAMVSTAYGKGQAFPQFFLLSRSETDEFGTLRAFSEGEVDGVWSFYDENRAILLFPDGQYFSVRPEGADAAVFKTRLPSLPNGFAYAGVALVGNFVVALWEEQDGWSVGSAGFLLMEAAF
jgi:hypothetical protein